MGLQNLFGDLGLEGTLQKIAFHLQNISSTFAKVYPDTGGNLRTVISSGVVTTVGTVSSVTNTAQVGGFNAQYDQYSQIQGTVAPIRNQIKIT